MSLFALSDKSEVEGVFASRRRSRIRSPEAIVLCVIIIAHKFEMRISCSRNTTFRELYGGGAFIS